jgi:hypothetical protein
LAIGLISCFPLGDVKVITLLEPTKKTEKKPCYSLSRPITGLGPSLSTTHAPLSPTYARKKKKKKKNCIIDFMCWPKLQMTPYRIKINSEITVVGLIYKSFMDSNFVKIFDRFC